MNEKTKARDMAILIVDDDYLLAQDLAAALSRNQMKVIGPAYSLTEASALLERHYPSAAVLDLNLHGQASLPLAELLISRGVPFCFASGYQQEIIPERYAGVPLLEKPINERRMIDYLRAWNIFSYSPSHEQETLFVRTVLTLYASLQAPYLHRGTPGPHGFKGFCPVTESRLFERCRAMFPEFQHRIAVAEAHEQPLASFYPTRMAYARQLLAWTELGRPLTMSAFETRAVTEATLLPAEWE